MPIEHGVDEGSSSEPGMVWGMAPPNTFGSQTAGATVAGPATTAVTRPSIALIPT
ncbi:hypothetical protein FHT28_001998 [Rhizobium sp. SG570]|nr:hypothetical protein [Rhizobium sp. SG570]